MNKSIPSWGRRLVSSLILSLLCASVMANGAEKMAANSANSSPASAACITNINVTLDEDCQTILIPAQVLVGAPGSLDQYNLELIVQDGQTANGSQIDGCGQFQYVITDLAAPGDSNDLPNFTSCWGYVRAEDKTAPSLEDSIFTPTELFCVDFDDVQLNSLPASVSRCFTVSAAGIPLQTNFYQTTLGRRLAAGSLTGLIPGFRDNCSDLEVCVNDIITNNGACNDRIITRTYTARDGDCVPVSGVYNPAATYSYQIVFGRPAAADVEPAPASVDYECDDQLILLPTNQFGDQNPVPGPTDYPSFVRQDGSQVFLGESFCNIGSAFQDGPRITTCANTYKFVRTWTVIDWCDVNNVRTFPQLVKVGDFTAPVVTAPVQDLNFDGIPDVGPLFFSANTSSCEAIFAIPAPGVSDNCDVNPVVVARIYPFGNLQAIPFGPYAVGNLTLAGIPLGTHTIRYVVTDACGNSSTVDKGLTIGDATAPVAICENGLNISIGGPISQTGGTVQLCAEMVDRASYDACSDIDRKIRITTNNGVNIPNNSPLRQFQSCHTLSCAQLGDLEVELRVTDDANQDGLFQFGIDNSNTCWLNVLLEDKLAPVCIAPAPQAVDCNALSGNFPQDLNLAFASDPIGTAALLDAQFGLATGLDNCPGTTVTQSVFDGRNNCGVGNITRTFVVTDNQDFTSAPNCTQIINVRGVHDYTVVFPADEESDQCVEPDYNAVTYVENGCDLLAVSTSVDTFTATAGECYKLRITYEVLNWCEYNTINPAYMIPRDADNDGNLEEITVLHVIPRQPGLNDDIAYLDRDQNRANGFINELDSGDTGVLPGSNPQGYGQDGSRGAFTYRQFIKVYDDTPPVLAIAEPTEPFCSFNVDCTGEAQLTWTITEECSPATVSNQASVQLNIDLGSDGLYTLAEFQADYSVTNLITGSGMSYGVDLAGLPFGQHALRVRTTDGCGNAAVDLIVFEVRDCKAPTPICINGLTVTLMPDGNGGGMGAIWASDYLASPSTDCSGPVKFAIYLDGEQPANPSPADTGLLLDCSHEGPQMVRVYAIDSEGNADYCLTTLLVQTFNPQVCGGPGPDAFAAGSVLLPNQEMMDGVEVSISGGMLMSDFTSGGLYQFDGLTIGEDYTIEPTHDPAIDLGHVSTGDLIVISRHILALESLNDPYRLLAADVTQDGNVNILDIIAIRRVILGLDLAFANTNSWRFYLAGDPTYAEVYNENNLTGNLTGVDFVAVEMGNVSGTMSASLMGDASGREAVFAVVTVQSVVNDVITINVAPEELAGFQGTLQVNAGVEIISVAAANIQSTAFNLEHLAQGLFSFTGTDPAGFTIAVRKLANISEDELIVLNDRMTPSEGYTTDGTAAPLELAPVAHTAARRPATFELLGNYPNPVNEMTVIEFSAPESGLATLLVQNIQGQTLLERKIEVVSGLNQFRLLAQELGKASGVLSYTLTFQETIATRQMLLIR